MLWIRSSSLTSMVPTPTLRFGVSLHSRGQDIKFSEEKIESCRNFANKVWNVSRFLLTTVLDEVSIPPQDLHTPPTPNTLFDEWILSRYANTVTEINQAFEDYNFAAITDLLWDFTWNDFCDWYVEASKLDKENSAPILVFVLGNILKLLSPYMPFVTDGIWDLLKAHVAPENNDNHTRSQTQSFLMLSNYPSAQPQLQNPAAETTCASLIEVIRNVRNIRASLNVPPKTQNKLIVSTNDDALMSLLNDSSVTETIQKLARVSYIALNTEAPEQSATAAIGDSKLIVPLEGLIDLNAERERLEKQRQKLEKEVGTLTGKLSNSQFTSKAPEHVVADIQKKAEKAANELKTVTDKIASFA